MRAVTYPGHHPGPGQWLDVVSGTLDTAMGWLEVARLPTTADDEALRRVRDAEELGRFAYQLLQELDGADADQIPHQIVGPFQRWVRGLGIGNSIFFRADHVANYELARFYLDESLKNVDDPSPSLRRALDSVEWPFLRLTVPSQAMGMLPHFAIVGHELGHAIQERIALGSNIVDPTALLSAIRRRLEEENLPSGRATDLEMHKVLASWIQEFKSDAVALLIAGPAFLFALSGFFEISGGSYGISPTHPPSDLRRRLVLERLRAGAPGHAEVFERVTGMRIEDDSNSPNVARLPGAAELYSELKARYGAEQAAICVEVLPLAEEIAAAVFDEAEIMMTRDAPDMIYRPEQLERDLLDHLDPLCALIPPIETRHEGVARPASLSGTLNVGWAALLTRLDDIGRPTAGATGSETMRMEKLHELLLKGVELAEARTMWDERP
ncbi:unannotated protein [freshwater metagenome]|uniref:Unannotated protein n=1 Tax=freshwater metagenome TaxID=449393 RepID=A0A6J7HKY0_9ZZZZ|nr:hypothetical protein [Actinomycetota bacterium]